METAAVIAVAVIVLTIIDEVILLVFGRFLLRGLFGRRRRQAVTA